MKQIGSQKKLKKNFTIRRPYLSIGGGSAGLVKDHTFTFFLGPFPKTTLRKVLREVGLPHESRLYPILSVEESFIKKENYFMCKFKTGTNADYNNRAGFNIRICHNKL